MSLCNHQYNGLRTTAKNLRKPKTEVEYLRISILKTVQQNRITAIEGIKQENVYAYEST